MMDRRCYNEACEGWYLWWDLSIFHKKFVIGGGRTQCENAGITLLKFLFFFIHPSFIPN